MATGSFESGTCIAHDSLSESDVEMTHDGRIVTVTTWMHAIDPPPFRRCNLLDRFPDRQGVGASGVDFYAVPGVADPADRRDLLLLRSLADALDLLAGPAFTAAFGGSTRQDDYRWGRLHRVTFAAPLGAPWSVPPAGGAFPAPLAGLPGVPVDGGFGTVDAASHDVRADSATEFTFGGGPVRRAVAQPGRSGIEAVSSLPGGTSETLGSRYYLNLLPRWLTNETYPVVLGAR